jgi:hypothetical protein
VTKNPPTRASRTPERAHHAWSGSGAGIATTLAAVDARG